jgi:phage baseplate assembly protein W
VVVKVSDIQSSDWSINLKGFGSVVENYDDIAQCLEIILSTPKGSDPHRPDFASNIGSIVDNRQTDVRPQLIRETYESILKWEPRITLTGVEVEFLNDEALGRVQLTIGWKLKEGVTFNQTVVTV